MALCAGTALYAAAAAAAAAAADAAYVTVDSAVADLANASIKAQRFTAIDC